MMSESGEAAVRARSAAEGIKLQADEIAQSSNRGLPRAAELGATIAQRTQEVDGVADRASQRLEALAETIRERTGDLGGVTGRAPSAGEARRLEAKPRARATADLAAQAAATQAA